MSYVDSHILTIHRRHAKKFSSSFAGESEADRGYERFREVVKDVEAVVDVLWVSGTPSLQTPYLIALTGLLNSVLPDYPFSPKSTFRLLRKLDSMFASLLQGEDVETGEPLPGFESKPDQVSMTEKVRIKSIAENTRITILDAQDKEGESVGEYDEEDEDEYGDGDDGSNDNDDDDDMMDVYGGAETRVNEYSHAPGRWEMESARVYERTIQILGDELGKQDV